MNTLKNNRIYVGSRLRISSPSQQLASNYTESYRVRRGDTLYGIAAKHNMSVQKLKKINNLRSNRIYIGARLKVSSQIPKEYRVRRGDNLHAIARKFGTTVGQIKKMNRLKRSTIYAGQVLRIGKDRT
jgi:membrane-bound lytic murein transglycosylase D